MRRSTDNGATFGSVVNLSNSNFIHSGTIFIAASGNNVYIVWGEHGPGAIIEMLFRRSTDNGATFESIVNLSNNDGESTDPKIAVLENKVYVVWNDDTFGNFEIFYRRSMDSGATFESIVNLSNSEDKSSTPTITATTISGKQESNNRINKILDLHIVAGGAHGEAAQNIKDNIAVR